MDTSKQSFIAKSINQLIEILGWIGLFWVAVTAFSYCWVNEVATKFANLSTMIVYAPWYFKIAYFLQKNDTIFGIGAVWFGITFITLLIASISERSK